MYAGTHLLAELWGATPLEDPRRLVDLLHGAARAARTTVVAEAMHTFTPQGLTGVLLLAESHLSLHTWPELDYIAVDIFTCGDSTDGRAALSFLQRELQPRRMEIKEIRRGVPVEAGAGIAGQASTG